MEWVKITVCLFVFLSHLFYLCVTKRVSAHLESNTGSGLRNHLFGIADQGSHVMGSVVWLTFLLYVRKFFVKILNLSNKFGRATWQILCLKSRKPCPGSMLVRKYINHCWKAFPCVWSIHMYVCFNMIS